MNIFYGHRLMRLYAYLALTTDNYDAYTIPAVEYYYTACVMALHTRITLNHPIIKWSIYNI